MALGAVEVQRHALLTWTQFGSELSTNRLLKPQRKNVRCWVGRGAGLDVSEKRTILWLCQKSNPGLSLYRLSYRGCVSKTRNLCYVKLAMCFKGYVTVWNALWTEYVSVLVHCSCV